MMKFFKNIVVAFLLLFATQVQAKTSLGVMGGYPEVFGTFGSHFLTNDVSLDGWLTLSTADLGVSGHIPLKHTFHSRHSIVLTGLGGYAHNLVGAFPKHGYHAVVAGGYGYQTIGGWDIRAQLGTEVFGTDPVAAGFHGHLMVGHLF